MRCLFPRRGTILDVKVAARRRCERRRAVHLEAMKMENEIVAPQDGTVAGVHCNKGDSVNVGDLLVSLN
ncbi:MAG: biotin/lipoyl-containing protein [Ruthenibacterium sp.]